MSNTRLFVALCVLLTSYACNQADNKQQFEVAIKDSISSKKISSDAAVEENKDSERKFIRTADIKFKVKNVADATYNIEILYIKMLALLLIQNWKVLSITQLQHLSVATLQ